VTADHLDESGQPCTKHPANLDQILTYAAIGSRVSSFNHDIASKLQGLMMALDEIGELLEGSSNGDLRRATETAQSSLQEATTMLSANRALTRTGTKTKTELRDLLRAAGDKVGVTVRGDVLNGQIEAVVPLLAHSIGLAIDAIAGTGRGRAVDVTTSRDGAHVMCAFTSTAELAKNAGDAFALAAFVVGKAGGSLRCSPLTIQLPIS